MKKKNTNLLVYLNMVVILLLILQSNLNSITYFEVVDLAEDSDNNPIYSDYWPSLSPISIDGDATGVGAHNWTWALAQDWCSHKEGYYIIENVTIDGGSSESCILIQNSDVNLIIRNCTLYDASAGSNDGAIDFYNVNNSMLIGNNISNNPGNGIYCYNSYENVFTENLISKNDLGFYFEQCFEATIEENDINSNTADGVYFEYSDFCEIQNNVFNNSGDDAMDLVDSHNNSITENKILNSGNDGIDFDSSTNNTIMDNEISGSPNYGIHFENNCNNNSINSNDLVDNDDGFYLYGGSESNLIYSNQLINNSDVSTGDGFWIETNCRFNLIYKNLIRGHKSHGVIIDSSSNYNVFSENRFLNNSLHAQDSANNYWNSTNIGNYWDNYTGSDSNNDGIGDISYDFIQGGVDYLPMWDENAPIISINKPISNEKNGKTPPSFELLITENYIDKMWYTLNDGDKIFISTPSGIIDSATWNSLSDGTIKITFYVNDTFFYESSASVMVEKDTSDKERSDEGDEEEEIAIPMGLTFLLFSSFAMIVLIIYQKRILNT